MDAYEERMRILEMIEQGVISSAQGAELIRALETLDETDEEEDDPLPLPDPEPVKLPPRPSVEPPPSPRPVAASQPVTSFSRWRNWWYYPMTFGVLLTIFCGWMIYQGTQNAWAGFWMACLWLPLFFGLFVIVLSWYSHRSLWLHVRVNTGQEEWPRRVAISMPLPLEFGAWVMRTFRDRIPGIPNLENVPLDELITAIRKGVKPESPIHIQVEEAGAEKVEVYIG
ncbi:MAG: hypothetical protein HUU38_14285 [Anaerolineales bacterium]|nr:hypothetical protein [Anaerolineales bacterium]